MALFLMDHLTNKIMILGRWKSKAFMVYIQPQVLEWTNSMVRAGVFPNLNQKQWPGPTNRGSNWNKGLMPEFHMTH